MACARSSENNWRTTDNDIVSVLRHTVQMKNVFRMTVKMSDDLRNGKWFEPRSLSRLCGLIVRVRVVPRRTVVGDIDQLVTLVNVTNNNPSRDYSHSDDQTTQTI